MRILTFCAIVFVTLTSPAALKAGYVWNGGSGNYADSSMWSTYSEDGKWVISGSDNVFTGPNADSGVNVTGGVNFTISGSGVVVSTAQPTRIEQGNKTSTFTITDGAEFSTTNTISISDKTGESTGYLNVDGGKLSLSNQLRVGFHHHGYLNVINGGEISSIAGTTSASLLIGGEAGRKGIGHVTVGGLDSDTNTGSISIPNIYLGKSSPDTTEMTVNNGSVTVTNFTVGTNEANSDGQVHDVKLNINSKGTVTASNGFSAANHAQKNALINIDGGTLSVKTANIGDAAGTAKLTITNSGSFKASENIIVGNKTTGTVDLQSGSILVAASETTYKTFYLGKDEGSNGTLQMSGGTLDSSNISVGENGTAKIQLSGGTITAHGGNLKLGELSTATGTFEMTGGTCSIASTTNVGADGVGTFSMNIPADDLTEDLNFTTDSMNISTTVTGKTSTATLTSGKAKVSGTLTVGQNGSLTLNGKNAALTVGTLQVSCNPGASNVEVSAGSLTASTVNVNSYGTFKVSGADANVTLGNVGITSQIAQATMEVSAGNVSLTATNAVLSLGNYAKLNVSGGSLTSPNITMDAGELNLSGGTLTSTNKIELKGGEVNISGGTLGNTVTTVAGGTLNLSGGTISGGIITVSSKSVWVKNSTEAAPAAINVSHITVNSTGAMYVNSPLESKQGAQQFTLNGTLDIGEGGNYSYKSGTTQSVFRMASSGTTALLNIHDGGVLEVSGNTRFLVGDNAAGVGTVKVDGAGSLLDSSAISEFVFGYHGAAKVFLTNGGKISTKNLNLGTNNAGGTVPASELTISGAGSAINATGTISIGSTNQKGILNLNASNTGFGTITANNLSRFTQKGSEINIGIDHGVSMIQNYTEAGYTIVNATTLTNWTVNDSSVWTPTVSGGTVTATLNDSMKQTGVLDGGTVTITDGLQFAGWMDYTIPEGWNIVMNFNGATSSNQMESLAAWLNEGSDGMTYTTAGNTISLKDLPASSGIFAWDFTDFNAQHGTNLSLGSVTAYIPEPATWVLLVMGVVIMGFKRTRNLR